MRKPLMPTKGEYFGESCAIPFHHLLLLLLSVPRSQHKQPTPVRIVRIYLRNQFNNCHGRNYGPTSKWIANQLPGERNTSV